MPRLEGKIALVTGAAQGIGQAIAALFVSEGATVIVSDINDEAGESVTAELGERAEYLHLDVAEETAWQKAAEHITDRYGHLDILVNNAGITGFLETAGPHDPENLDMASWHKVHEVNLHGTALGCKYGIQLMKSSASASIINVSSRSGMVGIPGAAAYASSKAAMRNHTKTVALFCADKNYPIRCNSLHPAAILTPLWDAMLGEGEAREKALQAISAGIPVGKMGDPMDVAYAAVYLAADESSYVTGSELTIDGGILAGSTAAPASD